MNPIRCVITDDEPMARKGLERYIKAVPFLSLQGVCEDAIQLQELLNQQPVDLLFLDIEMPYLTGLDLLKTIAHPPKVIFTTAYENYALQGYELDVLDYLLKPISFERFSKACQKAQDYFTTKELKEPPTLFIKVDGRLEKINIKDILFLEALENYVAVHTTTRKYITHATLKSMHQKLPDHFLQPHKSYLVNARCITTVEANQLRCGEYCIPLSKYQRQGVLERLADY